MNSRIATSIVMCLGLLACASTLPGPAERHAARLAEYQAHAGAPVEDFHFWQLDRWESLGKLDLAVYTNPNDAYLIRVRKPCAGLEFASGISLTSTQRRVNQRFDYVQFENQRCSIAEIRPVDVKALKAARRARIASE